MISYTLPPLTAISKNSEHFPLLITRGETCLFRQKDTLYPRTIDLPGAQNKALFKGGIISEREITRIAEETAKTIDARHQGKSILLITILEGARPFANLVHDYLTIKGNGKRLKISRASIKVRSYASGSQTTERKVIQPLTDECGKLIGTFRPFDAVILIDDLIDSGETIAWLVNSYFESGTTAIEAYFLLEKKIKRVEETQQTLKRITKVIGRKVPDEWVVGFGLDISLPRPGDETPKHLFRKSLPGGVYAFNDELESYLLEACRENNKTAMEYMEVYQSQK